MARLITKRNITILNLVLLGFFLITLIAVAIPLVKEEQSPSLLSEKPRLTPSTAPPAPKEQTLYTCPNHPEVRSTTPIKCPKCGSDLQEVDRFAAIVKRDLFFDPRLRPPKVVAPPPVPPLQWELVGLYKIQTDYMVLIRDRAKRVSGGFSEFWVRQGEEVPGYFGVTIVSIDPGPPAVVKYDRAGVGTEELKMGERTPGTIAAQKEQWSEIISAVRPGYTYLVRLPELERRIPSAEAYRGSFDLEPNMEGGRVRGLRITSLKPDNFLYAAGLRQGDVIDTINGQAVTDEATALTRVVESPQRFTLQLGITRGRTKRAITYTLLKK